MAEQRRKRRSFTAEYRAEAAGRVIESGRPVAHVARELGLGELGFSANRGHVPLTRLVPWLMIP